MKILNLLNHLTNYNHDKDLTLGFSYRVHRYQWLHNQRQIQSKSANSAYTQPVDHKAQSINTSLIQATIMWYTKTTMKIKERVWKRRWELILISIINIIRQRYFNSRIQLKIYNISNTWNPHNQQWTCKTRLLRIIRIMHKLNPLLLKINISLIHKRKST